MGAHYDHLDEGPFVSVAALGTMRVMRSLGMQADLTKDKAFAVFSGHGTQVTVPADPEMSLEECARLLVESARAAGAEEVRKLMRKALGV